MPKAVTSSRIRENAKVFEIGSEAVQLVVGLRGYVGYAADPDTVIW